MRCSSVSCKRIFDPPRPSTSGGAAGGKGKETARGGGGGRKIGTQENPIESKYYDVLGVPVNATTEESVCPKAMLSSRAERSGSRS